ncbi:hypothetical protein, partial [Amycolatopsis japonica]
GWNGMDKVRLFLCSQPGLRERVAVLGDRLQVRVSYVPRYQLWLGAPLGGRADRPAARVGKIEYDDGGFPLLTLLDDGEGWIDRETTGEENPGTYVQWAPAQAPRLRLDEPIHLGPQAPAPAELLVPPGPEIPARLVGWRPAEDETGRPIGPRTLREYLRGYPLLRGMVPWLRDGEQDLAQVSEKAKSFLAGTSLGQLPREFFDMVWDQVKLDKTKLFELNRAQLTWEAESPLAGTRLGNLPRELLDMVWKEMEQDLLEAVEAWFADILNELDPSGAGYRYSDREVAKMSGGLVDEWVVDQLRGVAQASWQTRETSNGQLSGFDDVVITEMLEGFADAAVRADSGGVLPNARVVRYVAKGTPDIWVNHFRLAAQQVLQKRLAEYGWDDEKAESVAKSLALAQVGIQAVELPAGDARIGTVHFDVDGQRPPGGMYGPETTYDVDDPDWEFHEHVLVARRSLADDGVDREDAVFTLARALVSRYSQEPSRFIGPATELQSRHEARYEAVIELLAWIIHRNPNVNVERFDASAAELADSVGLRRRHGVVGGESVPGGWVPVSEGVGRVGAGVVLGKAGSLVGRAARWLRRERGVFAVVVPGHGVPDAAAVEAAVRAAGWNGTDKLRLFLSAQDGLAELAAELAERLQVRVSYAKEWVWLGMRPARWGARPAAQVGKIEYTDDGSPLLTLRDDGTGWADKHPGGVEDKNGTPYLLTAPEQAPRLGLEQMIHLGRVL